MSFSLVYFLNSHDALEEHMRALLRALREWRWLGDLEVDENRRRCKMQACC